MADPTSGNTIAAVVTALGAIVTAFVAAWATTRGRRTTKDDPIDREDLPARLRERLAAAETRLDGHDQMLEHHDDDIALLRAQEITTEGVVRDRQRRGRQ